MKIRYILAYSTDKNFGKAINDHVDEIDGEDTWIVLLDGDTMFLTPDWGVKIHDALASEGDKYGLIGCYTNRLAGMHQLHNKKVSDDLDVRTHYEIAMTYSQPGIKETNKTVAGMFMAFKKSTWRKVGKFRENDWGFDTTFNKAVRARGMKIGLINGLYVFHLYRIWAERPNTDVKHLL